MNVKIDTKEKFTVITLNEPYLTANMTVDLESILKSYLAKEIPHIVLNMEKVQKLNEETGEIIAVIQQQFYENNHSFIICGLQKEPEDMLDKMELLELMNVTPTESEAWDIVQMEEIERELTNDEETGNES